MQADPYATGILDPARDERLVAGLAKFSRDAGIQPHWVWTSIKGVVGSEESNYLRAIRRHKAQGTRTGLCYVGSENASDISDRMCAVAGLLTRNYLRALVITAGVLLERVQAGDTPDQDCLLIPNFFLPKNDGGGVAPWHVAMLYDVLLQRVASGQQTIVFVASMEGLAHQYGPSFAHLLKSRFLQIEV